MTTETTYTVYEQGIINRHYVPAGLTAPALPEMPKGELDADAFGNFRVNILMLTLRLMKAEMTVAQVETKLAKLTANVAQYKAIPSDKYQMATYQAALAHVAATAN